MNKRNPQDCNAYLIKTGIAATVFMGLGHILVLHDWRRGSLFMMCEAIFIAFCPFFVRHVYMLRLGESVNANNVFALIDGICIIAAIVLFICLYALSIRNAMDIAVTRTESSRRIPASTGFVVGGLIPAVVLVLFFIIVPLVFSAAIAFTDYAAPDHLPPAYCIHWVGMENFSRLFGNDIAWSQAFGRVAIWTLVWGTAATVTCYLGGFLMAVLLKEFPGALLKTFSIIFILPYAVPAALSMLIWQNLLNGSFGIVNRTLSMLHIIDSPVPWLSDPLIAKFICIAINLWAGFPYFMLLVSGSMTAVSRDIYEAAKIDGANSFQILMRITFPIVTYQTMPLLIMSFAHNINNFGSVFFLTGGNPTVADSTLTSAGGTDILVSWIYKLTVNLMKYNYAAVLSIIIFVVLVPVAVFNFRRTRSFKEGEL